MVGWGWIIVSFILGTVVGVLMIGLLVGVGQTNQLQEAYERGRLVEKNLSKTKIEEIVMETINKFVEDGENVDC